LAPQIHLSLAGELEGVCETVKEKLILDCIVFHMLPCLLRDPIAPCDIYFQVKSLGPVSVMNWSSQLFLYRSNFTIRHDGINAEISMQFLKVAFCLNICSREVNSVELHGLQKTSSDKFRTSQVHLNFE